MGGMAGGHDLPSLTWHAFLTQWQPHPVWLIAIAVLLALYLSGARRARVAGFAIAAFTVGALLLAWSVSSVIEVYADSVFWVHMVQHLMLITVVPALLVLGRPLTVLAHALPGTEAVLRSTPVAVLTHPVAGLAFYTAVIVGTHLTGFMDRMMAHGWLGWGEQLLYLAGGYLYLLPTLGDEPIRWKPPGLMRMLLLVIGMVPDTVVGIVLLAANSNPFPSMLTGQPWAPDPVADVQIGGGLMWVGGDGLMMVLAVGVMLSVLAGGGRKGSPVGSWLEGVRRSTMLTHAGAPSGAEPAMTEDVDVDDDEAMLDAYNSMLRRMNGS